jgi:hypothetical protein
MRRPSQNTAGVLPSTTLGRTRVPVAYITSGTWREASRSPESRVSS